ncbi:MAG: hypothetical protein RR275_06720 [Lachnospiraceae bacterium]
MTTNITKRDKTLLILLVVFLLGTGFVVFIAMPSLNKRDELKTDFTQLQEQKDLLDEQTDMLPMYEAEVKANQIKRKECITNIYPMMESQEIDGMLTNIILSFNLGAKDLTIGSKPEHKEFIPYIGSQLAVDQGITKPEDGTTGDTGEGTANADGTKKDQEPMDIRTSIISVKAIGNPADIQRLIDSLTSQYPAIRIVSFAMESKENQSLNVDPLAPRVVDAEQTIVTLGLELYMCEKE